MALRISKKTGLILGIVMAVLMVGAGGYLLWRTNQDSTVAPTDSDASGEKGPLCKTLPDGTKCYYYGEYEVEGEKFWKSCICDNSRETGESDDAKKVCNSSCTSGNQCLTNYCYQGVCRNKACPTASDCQCSTATTTETVACGKSGCTKDSDCKGYAAGTHECDEITSGIASQQYCVRLESSCAEGQVLADDKCTCEDEFEVMVTGPTCGDGLCHIPENADNCPEDCEADCGDGYCTHDETAATCPEDCDAECGDGICNGDETAETCSVDCEVIITATTQPDTGLFDNVSNSIKLGLGFISLGFITTQANKVVTAYDIVLQNREIKIRRKRRNKIEKDF